MKALGIDAPTAHDDAASATAWYTLVLLTIIYALSFLDRNLINILLEPIKAEMGLSDTMLGFISGFGFVLFYSLLGIPVARLADRRDRVVIVGIGLTLWSAMTALCGLAQNAWQLALARFGVGVGEASSVAPSHALISDCFPRERRARAMAVFMTGTYLGTFLGYFIGGWVTQYWGWRAAFWFSGLPGIAVALVFVMTVRDVRRAPVVSKAPSESFADALRFLFTQKSFAWVLVGYALGGFTNFGIAVWLPSFLKRIHHLPIGEIGTYAGTLKLVCGVGGTLLGGWLVTRLAKRHPSRPALALVVPGLAVAGGGLVLAAMPLMDAFRTSIELLAIGIFLVSFQFGPVLAHAQGIARSSMRALASAIFSLTATLFGMGLGPLLGGMLNDRFAAAYGVDAIRWSLVVVAIASVPAGLCFLIGARHAARDLARADAGGRTPVASS